MRIDLLSLKDNNNNTEGDNGSEGRSVAKSGRGVLFCLNDVDADKDALSVYL